MKYIYADLHVHSRFSDGTMSPREILTEAEKRGIGLLAIADHDVAEGISELLKMSEKSPVKCVFAVEMTAFENGYQTHILAYGTDEKNAEFKSFIFENRKKLDGMSETLVEKLSETDIRVSPKGFIAYDSDTVGGWKALHYFVSAGVTKTLHEGIQLYSQYGCGYEIAGFPNVRDTVKIIKKAGGKAVLAHPVVTFKKNYLTELEKYLEYGIDGVECHYSEHSEKDTEILIEFCDKNNLLITCGSDCHGTFLEKQIGVPRVKIEKLRLDGII